MAQSTAQEVPAVTAVVDLPDDLRQQIVRARTVDRLTLAELKERFPTVAPFVIREVLPPLPAKPQKAADSDAKNAPAPKANAKTAAVAPKAKAKPTDGYVADAKVVAELREAIADVRSRGVGRAQLQLLTGLTKGDRNSNCVYQCEVKGKIRPEAVGSLRAALQKAKAKLDEKSS